MSERSIGERGRVKLSKLLRVTANEDYTLLLEFEGGHKIIFNMEQLIKTMPYKSLNDPKRFQNFTLEEKAIRWPDVQGPGGCPVPVRLTLDNILFTIRG